MRDYLEWRGGLEDREAPLFVTHRRRPYSDNAKACGGQIKHAWRPMIRQACARLRREGLGEVVALRQRGQNSMAHEYWRALWADLVLLRQVTPHWFRHLLATTLLATGDLRSTMEQGGWRDVRSVLGYSHDVPERRRALVEGMREPGGGLRVDTKARTQKNK